ncbi:Flp pilus assembly protein CpaB [Achromobacter xylosoxidans]|uniref:Flp pilus assembly protein CpaB n=1 Tax=Alcaligenes xylosoxydans xylosoxydans TaxID=85698 RepID=UPI001F5FCA8D|nr:Flp pilus assembly protein CpaB [Achromobacter xylosoxidans]
MAIGAARIGKWHLDPEIDTMMRLLGWVLRALRKMAVPLLALAAGLVAAWAVREHVRQRVDTLAGEHREAMVSRLVAARDLPAGTELTPAHLAIRDIPAQWAPAASIEPRDGDSVLGTRLGVALAQGDPVLSGCLARADSASPPALAARLDPGQRALQVPVADLGTVADLLRVGDLVDIYVSFPHRGREVTTPLLQGVRVLAVPDASGGTGPAQVTLAATPNQAMRYLAARRAGTLTGLVRNRADTARIPEDPPRDLASLIGLAPESSREPAVVILYGDRPGLSASAPGTVLADFESEHP